VLCLLLTLTPSVGYARSTRSSQSVSELCAKCAVEVEAARAYIADLEKRSSTAREQLAAAERYRATSEEMARLQDARIAALKDQIAALERAAELRAEQVKILEADLTRVRGERDSARRSRWTFAAVALALGVALGVAAGQD
jgi:polyhydroxyalkanoate synthesis regulator phasin